MSVLYGGVAYGVTPAGFVLPPVQVLITAFNQDLLGQIDPTTDLSPDQPVGQFIGVACKKLGEIWQVGQVAYNATNRGDAEADLLDNIGTLTGTLRQKQSPSRVQCTATFSAQGTYGAGTLVAFPAPPAANTAQFANVNDIVTGTTGADGVNPPSAANTWPTASASTGILTKVGTTMTLTGPAAGIPAGAGGQSITISGAATAGNNGTFGPLTYLSPSSVSWTNAAGATDANNGAIDWIVGPFTTFAFASIADGPTSGDALVGANAAYLATHPGTPAPYVGQLNRQVPVAGWASVADAGGVTVGTNVELDPPYRVRQYQDLSAPGNDTLDATAAAILIALQQAPSPPAYASVQMYENTTLVTDANGLPGKSYMAVIYDGSDGTKYAADNALIAQAIWNNKPGGMQAYGTGPTAFIQATDSQGNPQIVGFTRAAAVAATLGVTVYTSAKIFADPVASAALATAVQVALTNASQGIPFTLYGNTVTPGPGALTTLVPGQDVISEVFRSIAQGQAGVIDAQPSVGTSLITSGGLNGQGNLTVDITHYGTIAVTVTVQTFVP